MGKIFFSMSGEGRGHATRVRSMVEALKGRHEITLFCPGDAYDLLAPVYKNSEVRVRKIPGLKFAYQENHKVDYLRTGVAGWGYIRRASKIIGKLRKVIEREKPDLIVTDFEPALPRAAKKAGVPFISVNHQHFLLANDLSELPLFLRFQAWIMSWVVYFYYSGQAETVISQFYAPPINPRFKGKVTMAGGLMRPSLLDAKPVVGDFLLAYLRKFASDELIETLAESDFPVRLYGLGERESKGQITFCKVDDASFQHDLINCKALVTTAGNQLISESLFLGKPVLAMPEAQNYEQYINAFYLEKDGSGEWCELDGLTPERLNHFLKRLEHYRSNIKPEEMAGNKIVIEAIERYAGPGRVHPQ